MTSKLFYIRNAKTDQNFDTNEMKFFGNNWGPTYEEDKDYLQNLIESDNNKFQDCVVKEVELS